MFHQGAAGKLLNLQVLTGRSLRHPLCIPSLRSEMFSPFSGPWRKGS